MSIAKTAAAEQLAEWIATEQPQLFAALQQAVARSPGVGGITDILSSIGAGVSSAVKNVGSFLTSTKGLETLGALGSTYLATKTQQNVLQTQVALAQAGYSPAPITNVMGPNGTMVPIYQPTQQPVSAAMLAQLQPSFIERYGIYLALGGAAILALFLLRR